MIVQKRKKLKKCSGFLEKCGGLGLDLGLNSRNLRFAKIHISLPIPCLGFSSHLILIVAVFGYSELR